jgi:predicted dehydrogenase
MSLTRRDILRAAAAWPALTNVKAVEDKPVRRVRIGQVGTQHGHAAGKMAALRRLGDQFEVLGLAGAGKEGDAEFDGVPKMEVGQLLAMPGLEAVVVETDFPDLYSVARDAVNEGKHVHLDKPGALDHATFKAMRNEAAKRGLIFQMGYMLRYNPAFQLVAKAVSEGWLGKITEVDAMIGKKLDGAGRKDLMRLPGGGMFELGCHLVDAVCCLLGKPQEVHAFSKPTGTDGFQDNQLALLVYPGVVASVRCNTADPFGNPRRRFMITGTEGSIEIMPLESGRLTVRLTGAHGDYKTGEQQVVLPVPAGRYDTVLTAFAEAIRTGKQLPQDAAHDIAVHETVLRAAGVKP